MSLYLGKFGRRILNFTVNHPRVDRLVDHLSNTAHRILGDRFTPRLTRDMFILYQKVSEMEEVGSIKIRNDGFYLREEKLSPNPICNFRFPVTFQLDSYTPESLVRYIREVKSLVLNYSQRFGDPWHYTSPALDRTLQKARSVEELKAWVKEVKALILDYSLEFVNPAEYIFFKLPDLLDKVGSIEVLREVKVLLLDHNQRFGKLGHPEGYVKALPEVLEKVSSIEELREIKALILDYSQKIGNPRTYVESTLPEILEKVSSIEELKDWDKAVKPLIFDYKQRFRNPGGYIECTLPIILQKVRSIEKLKDWDKEIKAMIADCDQRFGNPNYYELYEAYEKASSIEELKEWHKEVKALIFDYGRRFGNPGGYALNVLPEFLQKVSSIEELRELKALILDFSQEIGMPENYIKSGLPEVLQKASSIEELKRDCKIAREMIMASVNPAPLVRALKATAKRSIIYESHRSLFIRFCKNSGPNLANNIDFFKKLTPENADELFAASEPYFRAMKTSFFLPLLFEEYGTRNTQGKEKLAQDFSKYYAAQVKGKSVPATELPAEIIEEINYSLAGSASLTKEVHQRTLRNFAGEKIPEPNFTQTLTLKLQKAKKTGSIPEKDIEFLQERISWLEEAVRLGNETDNVEKAIADFPPTDREGRKPSQKHTEKFMMMHLLKSYRSNLILPGIEPKESLLAMVDAEEFTRAVIDKIIEEVCVSNNYDRLCLTISGLTQSNRPPVRTIIEDIIEDIEPFTQTAQENFPQRTEYSISELVTIWPKGGHIDVQ